MGQSVETITAKEMCEAMGVKYRPSFDCVSWEVTEDEEAISIRVRSGDYVGNNVRIPRGSETGSNPNSS